MVLNFLLYFNNKIVNRWIVFFKYILNNTTTPYYINIALICYDTTHHGDDDATARGDIIFFFNRRHSSPLDFVQLRWWRRKPWMGGFRRMLGCCHIIIIIGWRWMKRWTKNIINITIIDVIALYYIIGFVAYYNKVNTSFNTLQYRILSALIISAGQLQ
jgi:hypothetical protein